MMRRWSICSYLAALTPPARVAFSFPTTAPPIPPRGSVAMTATTTATTKNARYRVSSDRDDGNNSRGRILGLGSLPPSLEDLVGDALEADRKIVVVTGGVLSGIGKGVTASSIGVVSFGELRLWRMSKHPPRPLLFGGYFFLIPPFVDSSSQLFRAMGYRVTAIKIDPYLNVDAGTMVRTMYVVVEHFSFLEFVSQSNFI